MGARLGLGTVQFGLPYGVSNAAGRTPPEEVGRILELASRLGVSVLDTAHAYGDAERVLGRFVGSLPDLAIVTKTPALVPAHEAGRARPVADALEESLERLRVERVHGLLVHAPDDLRPPTLRRAWEEMTALKAAGKVAKIGVSVYNGAQIDAVLSEVDVDLVQLPINILDQRLVRSGHLRALAERGVEIHARSVFLQGLLLMDPDRTPAWFDELRPRLRELRERVHSLGLTPLEAALAFVSGLPEVNVALCGVNDAAQLEEIAQASKAALPPGALEDLAVDDVRFVDPSRWRT